jgi:hypothetical protein
MHLYRCIFIIRRRSAYASIAGTTSTVNVTELIVGKSYKQCLERYLGTFFASALHRSR